MKNAKELYSELIKDDYFFGTGDYQPIIEEIGNVLIQVDDMDYQGDSRIMYEKDGKYGYLIFGWGSCSGCDWLQACSSYEQIDELIKYLVHNTKWFDTIDELKHYFATKDWELDYSWHCDEMKEFIDKVLNYTINDKDN